MVGPCQDQSFLAEAQKEAAEHLLQAVAELRGVGVVHQVVVEELQKGVVVRLQVVAVLIQVVVVLHPVGEAAHLVVEAVLRQEGLLVVALSAAAFLLVALSLWPYL